MMKITMKSKPLFVFELYRDGKLVGYESHGIDPDLAPWIGVYHKTVDSKYHFGLPLTKGDKNVIFHDEKRLIETNPHVIQPKKQSLPFNRQY